MKKRSILSMLVVIALIISAALPVLAEDVIKIGGIGVLSGKYGMYGLAVREGVDLYVKQINEKGGVLGKQVQILWEDTQGNASEAINAYLKLSDMDVVGYIGAVLSGESKALAEVTAEDGVPQISPSATDYDVTTGRPNVFRTCFLDPFQAKAVAEYMAAEGIKKVAVLYDNATDYSNGLYEAFKAKSEELGVEIVAAEAAAYGDTDYKTQLTTIQNAKPEAVFLPYYGADAALILAQAKELGLDVNFYGADGIADIVDYVADKSVLTKVVYTDHFSTDAQSEIAVNFVKAFEAEYGKAPTISFSATGYDAAVVLLAAIEAAGSTDAKAIVDAIKATNLTAVSGNITFDDHNDPIKSIFFQTFDGEGNKFFLKQVDP
ncbi:MAG: ABC transporter substrate-binding protein [Christensenellales bacterium]|jgi:branched-chain amino acid transport system substrate-binding protein|nr:ABC transporter substrate-binding protein [Clostridiales bacterium]